MILGKDKSRLSKRHGATSVQAFRDAAIAAIAMRQRSRFTGSIEEAAPGVLLLLPAMALAGLPSVPA